MNHKQTNKTQGSATQLLLKPVVTYPAASAAVLTGIGFIAAYSFDTVLRIPSDCSKYSIPSYPLLGFRVLFASGLYMLLFLIAVAIVSILVWLVWIVSRKIIHFPRSTTAEVFKVFKNWWQHLLSVGNLTVLTARLFFFTLVLFVAILIVHWKIAQIITLPTHLDSSVFTNTKECRFFQFSYILLLALLDVGVIAALYFLGQERKRRSKQKKGSLIFMLATGALLLFSVVFLAVPYRFMSDNDGEPIKYGARKAFILEKKDNMFCLYIPKEGMFSALSTDTLIYRPALGKKQNIFE